MDDNSNFLPATFEGYGDFTPAAEQLDNEKIIPQLKVLQAMSPQVQEGGQDQVPGARPGNLLNTGSGELFGKEGIIFVPIARQHTFVEWVPRKDGGGFVGMHDSNSETVRWARENTDFGKWKTQAGNDLRETFYVFGVVLSDVNDPLSAGEPVVLSITGTKIKPYRAAFDKIRSTKIRTPQGFVQPPMFAHRLRITTVLEKNKAGESFYNLRFDFAVENDRLKSLIPPKDEGLQFLQACSVLSSEILAGQRRAEVDSVAPAEEETSSAF